MEISLEDFKKKVGALDKKQTEILKETTIEDGLMDLDFSKYYCSKIKILWLMKEPYGGGGIHMRNIVEAILGKISKGEKYSHQTWNPIIYTSYGILNDFKPFNQMPKIQECQDVLTQIAFVNIKKTSGKSRTNDRDLKRYYYDETKHAFELIKEQLDLCQPNVVIGGNTLKYDFLKKDLGLSELADENKSKRCYIKDNRLYIDTYHPMSAQMMKGMTIEKYVDTIVNNVKVFLSQTK